MVLYITLEKSIYKGLVASGIKIKESGNVLFTISEDAKEEALHLAKRFAEIGYNLVATSGTAKYLEQAGLRVETVGKITDKNYTVLDAIYSGKINMIINTTSKEKRSTSDGFKIRRAASEQDVICLTSLDTADALLKVLESMSFSIAEV